jgi:dihydrolipoamide dehydrogenase
METYDLIILGGGPAGYRAAECASAGAMTVALFEMKNLGGVCLNEGCIPTKTFLHCAKVFEHAAHGEAFGVKTENAVLDHLAVLKRKNDVVKVLVAGVDAKMKAGKVTVIADRGIITEKSNAGYVVKSENKTCIAPKLMIAAGSKPIVPSIENLTKAMKSGFAITGREALELTTVPNSLVIIGAGIIGLEMAAYFHAAGSKVTVIEMTDKIAGPIEREISDILLKNLRKKGIEFHLDTKATKITDTGVQIEKNTDVEIIEADKTLLSIGRKPAIKGLGLESLGVYIENGAVVTDQNLVTNVPGVYAAGDINGKMMLAHTAYREAEVAVNHMLGIKDAMNYDAIPTVIYTTPEIACVGETEESAKKKNIPVIVVKVPMRYSGRYIAETERGDGICKLVAEERTHRILGIHMIGSYASENILSAAMMVESRWPADALKKLVFPHPTVSEVIKEALFKLK